MANAINTINDAQAAYDNSGITDWEHSGGWFRENEFVAFIRAETPTGDEADITELFARFARAHGVDPGEYSID